MKLFIISILVAIPLSVYAYAQWVDLQAEKQLIEIRIDEIEREAVELGIEMAALEELDYSSYLNRKTMFGQASYYDYVLANGWSSLGHYVCATRDFERYSIVKVTNLDNGKVIECKVTDYVENPEVIIDLSSTAFQDLAPLHLGIVNVSVEQL